MCGIGLVLTFSDLKDFDPNHPCLNNENFNKAGQDQPQFGGGHNISGWNQSLSDGLVSRGPDLPHQRWHIAGNSVTFCSDRSQKHHEYRLKDADKRKSLSEFSNRDCTEKMPRTDNNHCDHITTSHRIPIIQNRVWSLTLHASVLHMRGESLIAQPLLQSRDEDIECSAFNIDTCALCWNGECYSYACDKKEKKINDPSKLAQNKCSNNNDDALLYSRMEKVTSTNSSRKQGSSQNQESDTTLVMNLLMEAVTNTRNIHQHSVWQNEESNDADCFDKDICISMTQHEAIASTMGRIHGEYSFLFFVPSSPAGSIPIFSAIDNFEEEPCSGVKRNYEFDKKPSINHGFLYFGRDFLGRRSLLLNQSMNGVVILSSVAVNSNHSVQTNGMKGVIGTENTACAPNKLLETWEEISPGIVYRMDVATGEISSLPIPKFINVDVLRSLSNASAAGEDEISNCERIISQNAASYMDGDNQSIDFTKTKKFFSGSATRRQEEAFEKSANGLLELLDQAVQRRVINAPAQKSHTSEKTKNEDQHMNGHSFQNDASVAILFSGGIDSVVLAALSHRHIPLDKPIDLINVSFYEGEKNISPITSKSIPPTPDRLAAIVSYYEMRRRWPRRGWRFIAIDVSFSEVLQWEAHILRLIKPLHSTMDFNIATAFWFAARGKGRILNLDEIDVRNCYEITSGMELLRFARSEGTKKKASLKNTDTIEGNNTQLNTSKGSRPTSVTRPTCIRDGCCRAAPFNGCIFNSCKFCCGKLQNPISSFLGKNVRLCPAHNGCIFRSTKQKSSLVNPKGTDGKRNSDVDMQLPSNFSKEQTLPFVDACTSDKASDIYVTSTAKILLSGVGADEQMAGYARHRATFQRDGYEALQAELKMEVSRLWTRNLGRDDRCLSDHGKEARLPYLDEDVMAYLDALPVEKKCDMLRPQGEGDKLILRIVAKKIGVEECSSLVKRAIQFGSRIAKVSDKSRFGSNRLATGRAKHIDLSKG